MENSTEVLYVVASCGVFTSALRNAEEARPKEQLDKEEYPVLL